MAEYAIALSQKHMTRFVCVFFASTLSFLLSSRSRELKTILSLKVAGLLIILNNLSPI